MEYDASLPIYLQVIEIIKKDIVAGKRKLGEKLPSTRELAVEMGVNVNTAARIYRELEMMDIAYTKRGIGTFVSESDMLFNNLKAELSEQYVKQFLDNMKGLGYKTNEIQSLIAESMKEGNIND